MDAFNNGTNVWTGKEIELGRNSFSLKNTPILEQNQPRIELQKMPEFEVPDFSSRMNEKLSTEYQSHLSPKEKGNLGVKMAIEEFKSEGGTVLAKEVKLQFHPRKGGTYITDVVGTKDGMIHIIEAKYGPAARMTPNQKIYIPKMLSGNQPAFIPVGKNALGVKYPRFEVGKPYTGKYIVVYKHYFKAP